MPLTVLFDLDDTLLQTNGVAFIPHYFKALGESFSFLASPEKIIQQVRFAVQKMIENQDPGKILKDVFAEHFYEPLGTSEEACAKLVKEFYSIEYPKLEKHVSQKPYARLLIDWCHSQRILSAITTDPLFPSMATRQRIKWAGLNTQDFAFFTSYDDFHFTKPHLAYYAEVLGRLGWPDSPVVTVGDNYDHDIQPMKAFGFSKFWVTPQSQDLEQPHGTLADAQRFLARLLGNTTSTTLKTDPSVLIAILRSTPAVLDSWLKQLQKNKAYKGDSHQKRLLHEIIVQLDQREKQDFLPLLNWFNKGTNGNPKFINKPKTQPDSIDISEIFTSFLENRKRSLLLLEEIWKQGQLKTVFNPSVSGCRTVQDLTTEIAQQDRSLLHQFAQIINI